LFVSMTTKIGPMSFYFFLTSKLIIFSQPIKSENSKRNQHHSRLDLKIMFSL
jgi:hypothetical protein